jgi:hypothetical protein
MLCNPIFECDQDEVPLYWCAKPFLATYKCLRFLVRNKRIFSTCNFLSAGAVRIFVEFKEFLLSWGTLKWRVPLSWVKPTGTFEKVVLQFGGLAFRLPSGMCHTVIWDVQ